MVWVCNKRETETVSAVVRMNVVGRKGRPKRIWLDTIDSDMNHEGYW